MAVCNIFSSLSNPTGNFLMFSNYVDDMNRYRVQDSLYRVTASKFLAVDVDFNYVKTTAGITGTGAGNLNIGIPQLFQNMYENWIAFSKNNPDLGIELYRNIVSAGLGDRAGADDDIDGVNISENEYRKRLFWSFLYRCGFIKPIVSGSEISNIKYEGKTSLESYDNHSGEGYGELICHIPSESVAKEYHIDFDVLQKNQVNIVADGNSSQSFNSTHIEGYTSGTPISGTLIQRDKLMTATQNSNIYDIVDPEKVSRDPTSYKFNMVIVFYDIKQDGIDIESNIPMGVYFVGNFTGSGTQMSNERTIYIQNKDVFGASTTYSLRICTRYTVNPNRYGIDTDLEVSPDDQTNLSILLSKMSDNIDAMNKVLETAHTGNATNKELYTIFKSGQVNVPYIKVIDGISYWFVNGKLISQITFEEIDPDTISAEFNKMTAVWNGDYYKTSSSTGNGSDTTGPIVAPGIDEEIKQEVDPDIKQDIESHDKFL